VQLLNHCLRQLLSQASKQVAAPYLWLHQFAPLNLIRLKRSRGGVASQQRIMDNFTGNISTKKAKVNAASGGGLHLAYYVTHTEDTVVYGDLCDFKRHGPTSERFTYLTNLALHLQPVDLLLEVADRVLTGKDAHQGEAWLPWQ
jgi:hypothetical protein